MDFFLPKRQTDPINDHGRLLVGVSDDSSFYSANVISTIRMSSPYSPQEKEQELASLLPWGIIAESLELQEVLQTRLTCHSLCEALAEQVSPVTCSRHIARVLVQRNLYVIPNVLLSLDWVTETTRDSEEAIVHMLMLASASAEEGGGALDSLLRMIKVMKYLPKQAAVAFNGKHGRHLLPLQWDEEKKCSNFLSHEPCQRKSCVTCKFRIPVNRAAAAATSDDDDGRRRNNNNIDDHLEFRKPKGPIDLHSYHTTCVPNLPRDLHCPMCRTTDQRTLVLSEVAYRSDSRPVNRPDKVLLTWTPHQEQAANGNSSSDDDDDDDNDDDDDDDDASDHSFVVVRHDEPSPKRRKTDKDDQVLLFPPLYDDMAIPSTTQPIRLKADCKHAISIHCSHCGEFGVIGPAAVCWNPDFPCHERGHNLSSDKYQTVVGGVLVRSKCSSTSTSSSSSSASSPGDDNCQRSTLCESCTRGGSTTTMIHSAYLEDTRGSTVLFSGMCHHCHEPFCSDHVEFDGSSRNGLLILPCCRNCACCQT